MTGSIPKLILNPKSKVITAEDASKTAEDASKTAVTTDDYEERLEEWREYSE